MWQTCILSTQLSELARPLLSNLLLTPASLTSEIGKTPISRKIFHSVLSKTLLHVWSWSLNWIQWVLWISLRQIFSSYITITYLQIAFLCCIKILHFFRTWSIKKFKVYTSHTILRKYRTHTAGFIWMKHYTNTGSVLWVCHVKSHDLFQRRAVEISQWPGQYFPLIQHYCNTWSGHCYIVVCESLLCAIWLLYFLQHNSNYL